MDDGFYRLIPSEKSEKFVTPDGKEIPSDARIVPIHEEELGGRQIEIIMQFVTLEKAIEDFQKRFWGIAGTESK